MSNIQQSNPYTFRRGPRYSAMQDSDFLTQALDRPLSWASTAGSGLWNGLMQSVSGAAVRETVLPGAAPTQPNLVVTADDGQQASVPNTPNMRRRRTMFGDLAGEVRPETADEFAQRRVEVRALPEEDYKTSRHFRPGIQWDEAMTVDRAAALAEQYDKRKVAEFFGEKRPITAFVFNSLGQIADPVNWIPVFGPTARSAGFFRAAGRTAADSAVNTAVAEIVGMDLRNRLGDEVTYDDILMDIATSAAFSAGIGGLAGSWAKRADAKARAAVESRLKTLKTANESRIPLNEAVQSLADTGEVRLGPNSTAVMDAHARKVGEILAERNRQVVTPSGQRIAVEQEVVDARALVAGDATTSRSVGEARDIEQIANALDPDRLFPTQDIGQGAPIVGPDDVIESGKARIAAIIKAAEAHPERFAAYKQALREAGYRVPDEGVPVLVSRRQTDLDTEARSAFMAEANQPYPVLPDADRVVPRYADAVRSPSSAIQSATPLGSVDAGRSGVSASGLMSEPPTPSALAKAEDAKGLAAQFRVDPKTAEFPEMADIEQMSGMGRLSDADRADIELADQAFTNASAYDRAINAAVRCLV